MPHQPIQVYFQKQLESVCQKEAAPTENGIVERFIRTFKEEHINHTEYLGFEDAVKQIEHWMKIEYMTGRIYSSLDYLTPSEFEMAHVTI